MSAYELSLIPDYKQSIRLELSESRPQTGILDDLTPEQEYVYSDQLYSVAVHGLGADFIRVSFYINDYEVEQSADPTGRLHFAGSYCPKAFIFRHNFGLVQFSVRIEFGGLPPVILYTKYVPVLVVNARTNLSVQRMTEYIYRWGEHLLYSGQLRSAQQRNLKANAPKELNLQLQILSDIVRVYSENIGYFHTSAKFNVHSVEYVDSYEKVRFVSSRTLAYIVQHPEQLVQTTAHTGIRRNSRSFLPQRTLVEENAVNYDIYENQVVVGFLSSLTRMIRELDEKIGQRLDRFPEVTEVESGYFLSVSFVFASTRRRLEKVREQLLALRQGVEELYNQYIQMLPVSQLTLDRIPPPSQSFISVRPYRLIYEQIARWFHFGMYDFSREDFILLMLQSNKLYEFYVLLKIYNYIKGRGYTLQKSTPYAYSPDKSGYPTGAVYGGVRYNNTFIFENEHGTKELTLYYEPYVHNGNSKYVGENGVALFRNMSYSFRGGESNIHYWPDYVIKVKNGERCQYIILDAKFSTRQDVKEYQLRELLYKYLISISTIDPNDKVEGLVVINGKSREMTDSCEAVYNRTVDRREVSPFAQLVTLTENQEDNLALHKSLLDEVLYKII